MARPGSAAGASDRSPANGAAAADRLPDTPESLLLAGINADLDRGAPSGSDEDDPDEDALDDELPEPDEDAGALDDDAEGEDDGPEPADGPPDNSATKDDARPRQPRRSPEEWGKFLAAEGMQHVAQVPNKVLRDPAMLAAYGAEKERQAALRTQQTIAEGLEQQERLRKFVRDVDEHFADDPDGKLDWIETNDQGVLYAQAKRTLATVEQQTPQERVGATAAVQALHERSTRQFARLSRFPELQQELVRRQTEQQAYPATDEGLTRLERDVDELLEQGYARGQSAAAGTAPGGGEPERRQRPGRPLVNGGGRPAGSGARDRGPDVTNINDPEELFALGVQQSAREGARRGR